MEEILQDDKLSELRSRKVIEDNEIVILIGDLVVIENVITRTRRTISRSVLNETRRILKG